MHQNSRTLPRNQRRRPLPRLPTIYCGAGTIPQPRQQTLHQNVLQGSQTASQQNHTTFRPAETFTRYHSSSRQPNQHLKGENTHHGHNHPRRRHPNHQATNSRRHHHRHHHQHRNPRNHHRQIHHQQRRHSHLQHQRKHLFGRPPTHHQTHVRLLPLCGTIRHHHQQPRQPRQPIQGMTSEPNLHHRRHHPSRPMDLERRTMETQCRTRHATPTNRATTPRQQHCHHDRSTTSHRRLHPHLPAIQTAKTFS